MSFRAFTQRVFLNTYVDWHMKNPSFNRDGFHIVGIDNSVRAMHDGYFTYTQIRPPRPIHGCTSITARVADAEGVANSHLRIADTTHRIASVSYKETARLLRAFVTKFVLPGHSRWVEIPSGEEERTVQRFAESVDLLLGDPQSGQRFLSTALPRNSGDSEEAWLELSEELIGCGKAVELGLRTERDNFLISVKGLLPGSLPRIDESALSEDACIMQWCAAINSPWSEHVLAAMDIGSDTYVMLMLDTEEFARVRRLARNVFLRIAPAEQMWGSSFPGFVPLLFVGEEMVSQGLDIVFMPRVVNTLPRGSAPRGARARPCACAPSVKVWDESPSAELTAIL